MDRHYDPGNHHLLALVNTMEHVIIYRPKAEFRQNIKGILLPLTAAIYQVFGSRAQDQGRPIGAFYPFNISPATWEHLGGIWYRAWNEEKVRQRDINLQVVNAFARSILTGEDVSLRNGDVITWELIPKQQAYQLPPPLA